MPRARDRAGFRKFYEYLEECGLDSTLRDLARRHEATLFEVYGDDRSRAVTAARIDIWFWLIHETGRSPGGGGDDV